MKRKILTILLFQFCFISSQASFFYESEISKTDTLLLETIKDSSYYHLTQTRNYKSAVEFCNKGIILATEADNQLYLGKFYSYKGLALLKLEDYIKSEEVLLKSIQTNSKIDNKKEVSVSLVNIGKVCINQHRYKEALVYYKKNIEICTQIDRYKGIIASYNNIGLIQMNQGDYSSASQSFQNSLKLAIEHDLKQNVSHAKENLGTVYGKIGDYELSLKYYKEAKEIKSELNDKPGIINSMINIGFAYSQIDNKDLALQTYEEALLSALEYGSKSQQSVIYSNISAILLQKEKYNESLENSLIAYKLNKEMNRYSGLVSSGINISEAYMSMEKFDLAEKYILDALEVAKNNNIVLYYSDIYESLSDLYYTMGKYKEAYDYTKISWAYQDSLLNIEIASEIEELNIKYETSQKEKQIAIQELTIINQKEDIKHKTQINRLIIAGLLLTLIFILILLILYVQKRKAYKVLVQQNIALANSETRIIIPQKKQTLDNKYSGSNLSENQKDEFLIKFRKLMEEDEIYLNRQICIENVAEMIGTNRNYLSQLINEKFAMNFNNYINEFRVHRARQLLINPEYANFTIEAIANEAGFHSKATFNNSFKKFAGVTPSFFKNNQ